MTSGPLEDVELSKIVAAVSPGARLVASSTFSGGLSSEMVLVDAESDDGARRRFVVRRPRGDRGSVSVAVEFRVLETLSSLGLPVPEPLMLDESGTVGGRPFLVLDHVDGSPRVSDEHAIETAERLADLLASIHAVDGSLPALAELPERTARVAEALDRRDGPTDDSIREDRFLEVLRSHWPPDPPARSSLLHCDLWLGNILWSGPDVVAVIDWENAHVGDPLADLAITRLECAWSFGRDAMVALTERYVARTGADLATLSLWDLAAAGRSADQLSAWAADWANFGRADMTADRMRAAHQWFVADAFRALGEPRSG